MSGNGKKAVTAWLEPELKARVEEVCRDLDMSASALLSNLCKYAVEHRAELAEILGENVNAALLR